MAKLIYSMLMSLDGYTEEIAAHAIRAGLVDEFHLIVCPVMVGDGKRFFPESIQLDLELIEDRRFDNGVVALRYAARG